MRIEKIIINNYKRFKNVEISFDKNLQNDLHFIIGKNGSGKTSFLNAINWCLYNKEPHKTKKKSNSDKENLPRLNVYNNELNNNKVFVEIWLETEDNNYIIFHREEIYNLVNNKKLSRPIKTEFYVDISDEKGNRKIKTKADADLIVAQHFPEAIREYFFFDGERLDNYFQQATSKDINHEIFIISYINALENMHYHSKLLIKDLDEEGAKFSSNIEEIREDKEKNEKMIIENLKRIEEVNLQLTKAEKRVAKCHSLLKNEPNVSELEKELSKWKRMKEEKDELLKKLKSKQKKLLFDNTIILGLWPVAKFTKDMIKEKRNNLELPPVNEQILGKALKQETCDICGKNLDENTKKRIKSILEKYQDSSKNVKKLEPMEKNLNEHEFKLKNFKKDLNDIHNLIKASENDYNKIDAEISSINDKLGGHDLENIKNWHLERDKFEKIRDSNLITLDRLQRANDDLVKEKERLENDFDKGLKKNNKSKVIRNKIKFVNKALKIVEKTKNNIMDDTRNQIEAETNRLFFDLVWDEEYKEIIIDKNYNLSVIHEYDYECLDELSAAQRELLALSFTLALHRISGYEAPILIDTPVARISDDNRTNFAKTFLDVTSDKQIILLFTPNEYSSEIKELFDDKVSNKYEFVKKNKITELEVL